MSIKHHRRYPLPQGPRDGVPGPLRRWESLKAAGNTEPRVHQQKGPSSQAGTSVLGRAYGRIGISAGVSQLSALAPVLHLFIPLPWTCARYSMSNTRVFWIYPVFCSNALHPSLILYVRHFLSAASRLQKCSQERLDKGMVWVKPAVPGGDGMV